MKPLQSNQAMATGHMEAIAAEDELALQTLFARWLELPSICAQLALLEACPALLTVQNAVTVDMALEQDDGYKEIANIQKVWQEARAKGATAAAIRTVYIDRYGGWVLDVPAWLLSVFQRLVALQQRKQGYETAKERMNVLAEATRHAGEDAQVAPETLATLQHEYATACLEFLSNERAQHVEKAIVLCEAALQTYTQERYPRRYAAIYTTLGHAYRDRILGTQRTNRERAIECYQKALQIVTEQDDRNAYAQIQHGLGQAFQLRISDNPQDDLERAIEHCQEALRVYTLEAFALEYAQTLLTLGKVYVQRIAGERRDNLELAIGYYREAAALLTPNAAPVEYALSQHSLATAFSQRIAGERRDNLEQALHYYHQALRIYTVDAFPVEYARVQNNLGIVYWQRTMGERGENIEQAIACYQQAAHIFTLQAFPYQYAMLQNNLGVAYVVRVAGERRENLECAIACYRNALEVWAFEAYPLQYGKLQNNLGEVYQLRIVGDSSANLEQAIAYYQEALRIFTQQTLPVEYAMTQQNLGALYRSRLAGMREENFEQALSCYQNALSVYTLHAFPSEYRQLHIDRAEVLALRGDWTAVHEAYLEAHKAEDLLIALSTGTLGLDVILKEGRDATVRDGFALMRLGRVEEAVVTIERGRARGLAQAMEINTADPSSIGDAARRMHYIVVHQAFIEAQASLHAPLPPGLDEDEQRAVEVQRTADYRATKAAYDASVQEIRSAHDPENFLTTVFDSTSIARTVADCGTGHALVYLAATPQGGMAVAVLPHDEMDGGSTLFEALDLPFLTDTLLNGLVETRLATDMPTCVGGLYCAQSGYALDMLKLFAGDTFRAKAATLHEQCVVRGLDASLDRAAQALLKQPALATLVDAPVETLTTGGSSLLSETLCYRVLQYELQRCQAVLGRDVITPLAAWLQSLAVTHLTIVPCGPLALLPLGSLLLENGRMLSSVLPLSVVPSARSLVQGERGETMHKGIYALGNPYPTHQELRWSEAEALTLAHLGGLSGQEMGVKVQWQATRNWFVDVLRKGYVVDASCHGVFDTHDFLRSRLFLADTETLTLADMLSFQAELRGLRLLILSACQTAIIDLRGAHDELHSLAASMLQAGAAAILATLWPVDDHATYILVVRFAQEWFPYIYEEPPALALARAQQWLRTVTNRELQQWQALVPLPRQESKQGDGMLNVSEAPGPLLDAEAQLVAVRGRGMRFDASYAQELVRDRAEMREEPGDMPYADPYYWAGFQIIGW